MIFWSSVMESHNNIIAILILLSLFAFIAILIGLGRFLTRITIKYLIRGITRLKRLLFNFYIWLKGTSSQQSVFSWQDSSRLSLLRSKVRRTYQRILSERRLLPRSSQDSTSPSKPCGKGEHTESRS